MAFDAFHIVFYRRLMVFYRGVLAAFQCLESASRSGKGRDGGWLNRHAGRRQGERRWQLDLGKKMNSWGPVCIFSVSQGPFCKKEMYCATALFYMIHYSFPAKKNNNLNDHVNYFSSALYYLI